MKVADNIQNDYKKLHAFVKHYAPRQQQSPKKLF